MAQYTTELQGARTTSEAAAKAVEAKAHECLIAGLLIEEAKNNATSAMLSTAAEQESRAAATAHAIADALVEAAEEAEEAGDAAEAERLRGEAALAQVSKGPCVGARRQAVWCNVYSS